MSRDCEENPEWSYYERHRGTTVRDWDSGLAQRKSGEQAGRAKYNPHLYASDEAVMSLEMDCWATGTLIEGKNARYKHLGAGVIVGVCSGVETEYVFAECASGFVHGRPISKTALKRMGVDL